MHTENELIVEMTSILQKELEKEYRQGNTKRDAHPKTLGLVEANFSVLDNIPEELKNGVFKQAKTFKCWIRTSNASGKVQSDSEKDFRGFAIKLLGAEGERINQDESQTQDFLLLSSKIIPFGTVKLFRDAVYYTIIWNPIIFALKLLATGKISTLKALVKGKHNDTSPLDINFWSTTPYKLGNKQVKYKVIPTSTVKSKLPSKLSDDYLTLNMQKHLDKDEATFDFCVQLYHSAKTTPIENASIEWKEKNSPFIKIAEITIPPQQMNTKERFLLAEKFSYSPAHSLVEHQPIGGLNRARIIVYRLLSEFRHQRDSTTLLEPK